VAPRPHHRMNNSSPLDVAVRRAHGIDDLTLHLGGIDVTIGHIATALRLPPGAIDVDGRRVDGTATAVAAGLRRGSMLSEPGGATDRPRPLVDLCWISGLDAGASVPLVAGRHVVGRACGVGVRCTDAGAAAYSAVVDVTPAGDVTVTA